MPNRLINETSPYLLQHAHNPVDWYPWGEEAFDRARTEDKPIFLSVGYSACHWCHVMEHESFENDTIAQQMNDSFVSIKVDREERPDVDTIYMRAVQAQTGQGGWPMTVFMTPDGKPFFGGTYFPPEDRHGLPGFPRLLASIAEAYKTRRSDISNTAEQLAAHIRSGVVTSHGQEPLTSEILSRSYQSIASDFDRQHGGMGQAPKFPQPMAYEFLLRYYARSSDTEALAMVDLTLEHMASGGIYDQLGGGFHRYSTDHAWLVPHFEKMLYDNALLTRLYLNAYRATGNIEHRHIVEDTLDYVIREMTGPHGGFYSAQDADSEGEEGKYFVWTPEEIADVLGDDKATVFCHYYGVTPQGNFEGRNILNIPNSRENLASDLGLTTVALTTLIQDSKVMLLTHRQKRVPPNRDEKVITAWNGLMLRSFAEASATLSRQDYRQVAVINASFLLGTLRQQSDGRLLRTYKDGKAKLNGYLEDYAFLIDGLLALHEATLDPYWLKEAHSLADAMLDLFWDDNEQSLYDTGRDHEKLILRPQDVFDNATPSGGSVATDVLLRLGILTGNPKYTSHGTAMLRSLRTVIARVPLGFGHWLCALDFLLSTPKEIAIIGPFGHHETQALLDQVHGLYLPNKVITGYDPSQTDDPMDIPLLKGKSMIDGHPTAFVCQDYACLMPTTEANVLAEQLGY
ncbi:thioredoxin domain-containing protein [Dehalococcoidia bacterium]|nr:thioredoxin domain-containing protein [Dehalococcoidia bacterium]